MLGHRTIKGYFVLPSKKMMSSMHKKFGAFFFLFLLICSFNACYYDVESELYINEQPCDNSVFTYNGRVKAICDANCATASCHSGPSPSASLALDTYDQVRSATESGLICTIEQTSGCSPMPKNEPRMSQCNIDAWKLWSENNYPEN
jgi:hypothetical protein